MKRFSDLGIQTETQTFIGDKVKVKNILNKEITVHNYKIEESKFKDKGKCLHLQIKIGDEMRVAFTGSKGLISVIEKVSLDDLPFTTTIVSNNERFEFT